MSQQPPVDQGLINEDSWSQTQHTR